MADKELLFATLRRQATEIVPWVPFAGVHAGKLRGYSAHDMLTDETKLVDALREVNRLYDPDGQPIVFDLQVEAEILGCELVWTERTPPAVATHPLAERPEVPTRLPEPGDGRLPLALGATRALKRAIGDRTALYGLVCGPLTLASHLRGTDLFMDVYDRPDFVAGLLAFARDAALRVAEMYIAAGADVIALVDPVASQIAPRHFANLLAAPYQAIFAGVREMNAIASLFVCGDATRQIEGMCRTQPDNLMIDENIDLTAAQPIAARYGVSMGGNIPLTTHLLMGSQQENMQYVVELLGKVDRLGFVLAPGCDMPYDTPPENVIAVVEAVRDPAAARRMLTTYHAPEAQLEIALPDYAALPRPLMEVFTLDSTTCAACGYMLLAAERAAAALDGVVDLVERRLTTEENVARLRKMGIRSVPSILIDGEPVFASIIPSQPELLEALRLRIARH